ncbi:hypothetical protein K438DRAFT_1773045 [Mycena galopus ATCC 62051]|nr:hypothetical protein K438DRAFT_1773045 [Mycena galopus ATCC 62051]
MAQWSVYLKSLQTGGIEELRALEAMKKIEVLDSGPATLVPMAAFTDMIQSVLAVKTLKNFQAMGTALVWIIECDVTPLQLSMDNIALYQSFDWLPIEMKEIFAGIKIGPLLRPLTYTINLSLVLAICDHDLTGQHGHISLWYRVRALLGSYRTPRIVHLENIITTVMRHVAIGFPAKDVVLEHWYPGLLAMPPHQDDAGIFAHLSSDTEKPHPPRQRRKASCDAGRLGLTILESPRAGSFLVPHHHDGRISHATRELDGRSEVANDARTLELKPPRPPRPPWLAPNVGIIDRRHLAP